MGTRNNADIHHTIFLFFFYKFVLGGLAWTNDTFNAAPEAKGCYGNISDIST